MRTSILKIWITSGIVLILLVFAGRPPMISFFYQTPNIFPALGLRLLALLLAVLLLGSFYGIGILICPIIGLKKIPKYMEMPVQCFIGFILASVAVY